MGRKIAWVVFVVAFLFLMVSSPYAAEVIKLKFANYFPPTHMNSVMMGKYCEELNKKLAGKVEITQYTGSTLLCADKMAAGVASGIADIGLSNFLYEGTVPCHGNHGIAPRFSERMDCTAMWPMIFITNISRKILISITCSCSAHLRSTSSRR